MRRPRWVLLATVVAAATAFAGCTKGEVEPLPAAPKLPATTTTLAVDLSGISLAAVPGRTTTTIAMQPGQATISGTVVGPEGPVPSAIVRAERVVGDGSGSIDILTGADGTFAFTTMKGGRYRVRAWKPAPDNLALVEPEVFFLESAQSKVLALTVRPYRGVSVASDIAPKPPVIGEPANLVVQVVDQVVDAQGVVRGVPVGGARVELFGAGDWRVPPSSNPATTDGSGRATFTLTCQRAGPQPLSVVVGDTTTFPLQIPPCAAPLEGSGDETTTTSAATPTTAAPAPTTTARPSSTTTTTAPRSTTTAPRSTTTTR